MSDRRYDGHASVSPNGERVRVQIEAANVRAEVYIDHENARDLYEALALILAEAREGAQG